MICQNCTASTLPRTVVKKQTRRPPVKVHNSPVIMIISIIMIVIVIMIMMIIN